MEYICKTWVTIDAYLKPICISIKHGISNYVPKVRVFWVQKYFEGPIWCSRLSCWLQHPHSVWYFFESLMLHFLSRSLLIHPGKASGNGPCAWVPAATQQPPNGVPGSWFKPGPAPAGVAIWDINQLMGESFFLSLLLFCDSAFQIKKQNLVNYVKIAHGFQNDLCTNINPSFNSSLYLLFEVLSCVSS